MSANEKIPFTIQELSPELAEFIMSRAEELGWFKSSVEYEVIDQDSNMSYHTFCRMSPEAAKLCVETVYPDAVSYRIK